MLRQLQVTAAICYRNSDFLGQRLRLTQSDQQRQLEGAILRLVW